MDVFHRLFTCTLLMFLSDIDNTAQVWVSLLIVIREQSHKLKHKKVFTSLSQPNYVGLTNTFPHK